MVQATAISLSGGNPWLWLMLLLLFIIGEALTVSAVSIWFVFGALAAMLFSLFVANLWLELFLFLGVSILTLCLFRAKAVSALKIGVERTDLDALIGKAGVVIQRVDTLEPGNLKIDGKVWRCQSLSQTTYEEGDIAQVQKIEGVTLYVD